MRSSTSSHAASRAQTRQKVTGAAAVEFTLVFPLLLLVVFGVVEFGIALYDKAVITNASREAARAGIVLRQTPLTGSQIQAVATSYCQNKLVTFGTATNCSVPTPTPCPSASSAGTPLKVEVDYTFNGLVLGPLFAPFTGPLAINAVTTMLCE
ncbi:TadE/TadG family type IV pilus assembly protein [Ralstonia solanacearum]|uniref:TadE/TadG family type IV pilus assembly protein n=1 Tax=Ralstonia solanacearum TaxID=305 RepID=UPI0018D0BEA7|nr:TadE/TadG family type IV pilus assembly protein [Ralstonia solanacearum]